MVRHRCSLKKAPMKISSISLFGLLLTLSVNAALPKEDNLIKELRLRFFQGNTPQEEDIYDIDFTCEGRKALAGNFDEDFSIKELTFHRTIGYLPFVSARNFRLDDHALVKFSSSYVGYIMNNQAEEFLALRVGSEGELLWEASIVDPDNRFPFGINSVIRYAQRSIAHAYGICRKN